MQWIAVIHVGTAVGAVTVESSMPAFKSSGQCQALFGVGNTEPGSAALLLLIGAALGFAVAYAGLRAFSSRFRRNVPYERPIDRDVSTLVEAQKITQVGSFSWNLESQTVEWSEELYKIYGRDPKSFKVTYQSFLECLHPDDRNRVLETIERACKQGGTFRMEERIIRPDGIIRDLLTLGEVEVDKRGRPGRLIGICHDITEQKRSEEELELTRRFNQSILDALTAHIAVLDESGKIIAVNDAWRRFADANGLEWPDHGVGSNYLDVCRRAASRGATAAAEVAANIEELLAGRKEEFRVDYACHSPRVKRWFQVRVTRFARSDQVRIVTAHENVTDVKLAEESVQRATDRLQSLSRRLLDVQEKERRHIARELHDEIGQALTAVVINLQAVQKFPDPARLNDRLEDSVHLVDRVLRQVRSLSLDLRPPLLDDLGLLAALRWYVDQQGRRAGLRTRLVADAPIPRLDSKIETACFRTAQEAITNVIRHSRATTLTVQLEARDGNLCLTLKDNGVGFNVEQSRARAERGGSSGMTGLEERAALVGGTVNIRSSPDEGTEVSACFPLTPRKELPETGREVTIP